MRQCWTILAVLLLLLPATSCRNGKEIDRRVSLRRRDKIPYGTKVAYEGLQSLFPNATVTDEDKPPALLQSGDGKIACIIVTVRMDPSPADINSILDFVGSGNHVFISARAFGDSLLHTLGLRAGNQFWLPPAAFGRPMDSLRISIRQPVTGDSLAFSYPGDSYEGWVESYDPKYAAVLGHDHFGRPNFVRFTYKGGGSLYLHFAPLAFSNFFLLHKDNISYYQDALSYLPASVQTVAWDGYYARKGSERDSRNSFPVLSFIMRNPSLAAAFWLLLLLFLLIYLFESKRRQRNIPIIEPLRNTSLEFVKTIGRL